MFFEIAIDQQFFWNNCMMFSKLHVYFIEHYYIEFLVL